MEKPVAAIELCSKSIKIVIGYVLDNKVHVLYTLTKEFDKTIIDRGTITEPAVIKSALESFLTIDDKAAKLKINIADALLAIPPYGVEVFQSKPPINTSSEDDRVGEFDIKRVYTIMRKSSISAGSTIVDIMPTQFILDQDRVFTYPPIGQKSKTLQIYSYLHTIPSHIYKNYVEALESSNIGLKRPVVASAAAVELLASYGDEYPSDYFLVDIGSKITTVSMVGYKQLFYSRFFSWGGYDITKAIKEEFDVDDAEAEKIKMLYGYDTRKLSFDATISVSEVDGKKINHTVSDLNKVIGNQLSLFSKELNNALNSLLDSFESHREDYQKLPMVLIGGGSSLYGLKEYLSDKVTNSNIIFAIPKTLGARNSSYFNCLGMILMNYKYPNTYDDVQKKVTDLSRNPLNDERK